MGRPRTEIGTVGRIKVKLISQPDEKPARWEASGRYRRKDGSVSRMRRTRSTEAKAEAALKTAIRDYGDSARGDVINGDTPYTKLTELWLKELKGQVERGEVAPNTYRSYEGYVRNWILPVCRHLAAREVKVKTYDEVIQRVRDMKRSNEVAAGVKKALRGIDRFAVRHEAFDKNIVRDTATVSRNKPADRTKVRVLDAGELADMLRKVRAECDTHKRADGTWGTRGAIWRAIPDILEGMLSTTSRLGEVLACGGEDVTLADDGRLAVDFAHHIVHGKRVPGRKGGEPPIKLKVAMWSVPMWTRRAHEAAPGSPLFPSAVGGWLDENNAQQRINQTLDKVGYGWVTSHHMRKVGTRVMDEANVPTTAMADQLGNTPAVLDRHYRGRRATNDEAVAALDGMFGQNNVDS
jgi:integrase